MKKLDELGISPAPWRFIRKDEIGADVRCSWKGIALKRRHTVVVRDAYIADARLIVAAPKLYRELWKQCFGEIDRPNCRNCLGPKLGKCHDCPLGNARAALAEAAGEDNKKGETE